MLRGGGGFEGGVSINANITVVDSISKYQIGSLVYQTGDEEPGV